MKEDEWLEKMRSISSPGLRSKVRVRALTGEGKTRGYEIDRHDGSIEAVVRPETVEMNFSVRNGAHAS